MKFKNLEISWIFETDLSNMNAGEGSTNLKEIKTYGDGLPYISGQSMRHALRESMRREHKDNFKCTPEFPCGDIKNCWTCDLFGYLLPKDGSKRWSPIKASPALGQIKEPITTDMVFRLVEDIKCTKCGKKIYPLAARKDKSQPIEQGTKLNCPECGNSFDAPYNIRQAIAYKQLIKNIYKTNLSIDLANIGLSEVPKIENSKLNGFESIVDITNELRLERIKAIVDGVYNMADFANQSREMVNTSPDFVIISLQEKYNHRLASVLKLDKKGVVDKDHMISIINEILLDSESKIFAGLISGVIPNENKVLDALREIRNDNFKLCDNPKDAFNKVIESIE